MKWCGLATSLRISALVSIVGRAGRIPIRLVCETNLLEGRDRKISISSHQTDSSIMAKLLKIAKTKDVPLPQLPEQPLIRATPKECHSNALEIGRYAD